MCLNMQSSLGGWVISSHTPFTCLPFHLPKPNQTHFNRLQPSPFRSNPMYLLTDVRSAYFAFPARLGETSKASLPPLSPQQTSRCPLRIRPDFLCRPSLSRDAGQRTYPHHYLNATHRRSRMHLIYAYPLCLRTQIRRSQSAGPSLRAGASSL